MSNWAQADHDLTRGYLMADRRVTSHFVSPLPKGHPARRQAAYNVNRWRVMLNLSRQAVGVSRSPGYDGNVPEPRTIIPLMERRA